LSSRKCPIKEEILLRTNELDTAKLSNDRPSNCEQSFEVINYM